MRKLIIIPLLFIALLSYSATYWVTPRGSDSNAGTDSSSTGAWLTWQKAFNTAIGHDTVYFRGGIYPTTVTDGSGLRIGNSGTVGNYICFFAYQPDYEAGNYPTLDCGAYVRSGLNDGIKVYNRSYLHFKGLQVINVRGTSGTSYVCNGIAGWYITNVKFENCIVHDIDGVGFGMFDFYSVYLYNCDAYNCGNVTNSTRPGDAGTGIALVTGNATYKDSYAYAYGCRAWNCSDQGMTNGGGAGYVVFDKCWAWDNGKLTGNLWGMGSGFKYSYIHSTSTTDSIVKLNNCISAENNSMGFNGNDHYTYEGNNCTFNCFSYHNGDGWENLQYTNHIAEWGFMNYSVINESPGFGRVLKNNLAYNNFDGDYHNYGGTVTTEYNNWNTPPGVTVDATDFQSLDYTQLAGARKADGSLPNITFGRLASTSDCIDAGTDVGLSYDGAAPDLGWAEYEATGAEPVVLTLTSVYAATTSASVNCNVIDDGGGTISARGVVWSTDANPDLTDNVVTVSGTTGAYVANITGLTQGTTYHVRAYATNEVGTSYYPSTGDTEFTTKTSGSGGVLRKYGGKIVFLNGKWIRL